MIFLFKRRRIRIFVMEPLTEAIMQHGVIRDGEPRSAENLGVIVRQSLADSDNAISSRGAGGTVEVSVEGARREVAGEFGSEWHIEPPFFIDADRAVESIVYGSTGAAIAFVEAIKWEFSAVKRRIEKKVIVHQQEFLRQLDVLACEVDFMQSVFPTLFKRVFSGNVFDEREGFWEMSDDIDGAKVAHVLVE